VKSALDKISNSLGSQTFSKEREQYEHKDVSILYTDIIRTYPDLQTYLNSLGFGNTKKSFQDLNGSQKIIYTALEKTFNLGKGDGVFTKIGLEKAPKD
jgi:hypothetical protein